MNRNQILKIEILCTLGPASLNERTIARLEDLGVNLFRINLSHTRLDDLPRIIDRVQAATEVPLCLDTEGAQIRTGALVDGRVALRENRLIRIYWDRVPGDQLGFNFYPPGIVDALQVGDFISIDFNSVLVQIIDMEPSAAIARVLNGGEVGQNKAVTVERPIQMPPLTDKDRSAIEIARSKGVRHYALSFARQGTDVDKIRHLAGSDTVVISKVECRDGLRSLDEIVEKSDAILIDRGDLSREVPIERIPPLQKLIIRRGREAGNKVYVATNLLESMVKEPLPTRAEVNDVFNTLSDGAHGLVLAAETAIGEHPVGCASMIVKLAREFEANGRDDVALFDETAISLLVEPHGGELVHREMVVSDDELNRLPRLEISYTSLMDCQQIAVGTYSPLTGFMDREALEAVLNTNRLPSGLPWTMPILLQVAEESVKAIGSGERIALAGQGGGPIYAIMDVSDIYLVDIETIAKQWFLTDATDHPGVASLLRGGNTCVAGDITLVRRLPPQQHQYELTPAQTRFIFSRKGWNRVVGFHTRNVIHRAHEAIQLRALEESGADGLYISPVIGPKKKGDFQTEFIMKSYQLMLDFRLYPLGKVVLGTFSTFPRYCGPREAVFTALCRKNMGCSHFIIGRDHAGVGDFYTMADTESLFDSLGDFGVTPMFFGAVGYNPEHQRYEEVGSNKYLEPISGTRLREALISGSRLPDWYIRDVVQDMLFKEIGAGHAIFCE